MCGIFAIFSKNGQSIKPSVHYRSTLSLREIAYRQSGKQRHRGPDDTGVKVIPEHGVVLVHERLAVIGVKSGHQPLISDDGNVILIANGEIYNYLELAAEIAKKRGHYTPKSDCNVIVELYEEYGENLLEYITGMFSFVLYDKRTRNILIARDPFGIIPLYIGEDIEGNIWIASEMKCIVEFCNTFNFFPPGHLYFGKSNALRVKRYYEPMWRTKIPTEPANLLVIRDGLLAAVRSHLQCDVPFGALLSGGLDSSLVAAIATKIIREKNPKAKLRTFAVGMVGSPDLKAARLVADYIGSDHTEVLLTVEKCMDGVRDLIYHLESYDVGTVRCSLPMFYIVRHIKSTGIKVILSGEGSDEIFGGYLYFYKAPNIEEFHWETVRCLENLHLTDVLRANKVTMSVGLELRVPFLDREFVDSVMSVRPEDKIPGPLKSHKKLAKTSRIEKFILRTAFSDGYLPQDILWRQKEQFSDGVGYGFLDALPQYVDERVTDSDMEKAQQLFPYNVPKTKEAFFYRKIFAEYFPSEAAARAIKIWGAPSDWKCPNDPSGRMQEAHKCCNG